MALFDIYNIESRLREWDENVLRIDFDEGRGLHKVVCKDKLGLEYVAMTVPVGKLDARVVHRMMEINPKRGYNPFDEIDQATEQREQASEKRIGDMAHSMADMLYRPLMNHALYSR